MVSAASLRLRIIAPIIVLAAACSETDRPTAPPTTALPTAPSAQIQDGRDNGDAHFYWLPPIAANGGQGGIVGSNAAPGTESARVLQVGLFEPSDHTPGSSSVRLRRTAYVFLESYARVANPDTGALKADVTFRFLRFGP